MDTRKQYKIKQDFIYRGIVRKEGTILKVVSAKANFFGVFLKLEELGWTRIDDPIMQFLEEIESESN